MKSLLFWCTISSATADESFTVNSLNVNEESLGNKNLWNLQLRVPIAEIMVLNGKEISVLALCALQKPYKIPGLLPIALIFLYWSVVKTFQIIVYTSFMVDWKIWFFFLWF